MTIKEIDQASQLIIRSLFKINSAIQYEADELDGCKSIFKKEFKRYLPIYIEHINAVTKETNDLFVEANDEAVLRLGQMIKFYSEGHFIKNEEATKLFMFYAKIRSSQNDMDKIANIDHLPIYIARFHGLNKMILDIMEKQFKHIINLVGSDGVPAKRIIEILDEVGDTIQASESVKENEES